MGADGGGGSPQRVTLPDLDQAARRLVQQGKDHRVWLVHGEMGSGKTTMIKALCRQLGVKDTPASPTFALVHEYRRGSGDPIYHVDLYRLRNEHEVMNLGIGEYLDSGHYCFIEWPERAPGLVSIPHADLQLSTIDKDTRLVSLELHD
jgi:tRNA threonylcarbamoyladenosine biosynthesis protein TsaE